MTFDLSYTDKLNISSPQTMATIQGDISVPFDQDDHGIIISQHLFNDLSSLFNLESNEVFSKLFDLIEKYNLKVKL